MFNIIVCYTLNFENVMFKNINFVNQSVTYELIYLMQNIQKITRIFTDVLINYENIFFTKNSLFK